MLPSLDPSKTMLFGLGAQKAGTSWLYDYLARRGDVSALAQKEFHFFDTYSHNRNGFRLIDYIARVNAAKKTHALRQRRRTTTFASWLAGVFDDVTALAPISSYKRALLGEGGGLPYYLDLTPENGLASLETAREMINFHPNVKFIFIARDPVERLWSAINFYWEQRDQVWTKQFRESPRSALDFTSFSALAHSMARTEYVLAVSRYQNLYRNFADVAKTEMFKTVFYETLFSNETVEELCDFLNIPFVEPEVERRVNSTKKKHEMPKAFRVWAANHYASTYAYMSGEFDISALPLWSKNMSLIKSGIPRGRYAGDFPERMDAEL